MQLSRKLKSGSSSGFGLVCSCFGSCHTTTKQPQVFKVSEIQTMIWHIGTLSLSVLDSSLPYAGTVLWKWGGGDL